MHIGGKISSAEKVIRHRQCMDDATQKLRESKIMVFFNIFTDNRFVKFS